MYMNEIEGEMKQDFHDVIIELQNYLRNVSFCSVVSKEEIVNLQWYEPLQRVCVL